MPRKRSATVTDPSHVVSLLRITAVVVVASFFMPSTTLADVPGRGTDKSKYQDPPKSTPNRPRPRPEREKEVKNELCLGSRTRHKCFETFVAAVEALRPREGKAGAVPTITLYNDTKAIEVSGDVTLDYSIKFVSGTTRGSPRITGKCIPVVSASDDVVVEIRGASLDTCLDVRAASVVLTNVKMDLANATAGSAPAIKLSDESVLTGSGLSLRGDGRATGIVIAGQSKATISGLTMTGFKHGIEVEGSSLTIKPRADRPEWANEIELANQSIDAGVGIRFKKAQGTGERREVSIASLNISRATGYPIGGRGIVVEDGVRDFVTVESTTIKGFEDGIDAHAPLSLVKGVRLSRNHTGIRISQPSADIDDRRPYILLDNVTLDNVLADVRIQTDVAGIAVRYSRLTKGALDGRSNRGSKAIGNCDLRGTNVLKPGAINDLCKNAAYEYTSQ